MRNFRLDYVPDGETPLCGIDFNLTDEHLALSLDDLIETVFKPAISQLLPNIQRRLDG